jgi:hypothetical protein
LSQPPGNPAGMNDALMDLELAAPWVSRRVRPDLKINVCEMSVFSLKEPKQRNQNKD